MACQYEINGVWYSEEEVKSIFEQSEKKSKEYYALVDKLESATPEEKQDIEAEIAELEKEFSVESKEELPPTTITETAETIKYKPNQNISLLELLENNTKSDKPSFAFLKITHNVIKGLEKDYIEYYGDKYLQIKFDDIGNLSGNYDRDNNVIRVSNDELKNFTPNALYANLDEKVAYIISHEMVHKLLPHTLSLKKEAYQEYRESGGLIDEITLKLDALYEYAKNNSSTLDAYGFTNVSEFAAEAMSNLSFQQKLAGIQYSSSRSVWDEFIRILSSFFAPYNTIIESSVLEQVIYEITNYINHSIPETTETKPTESLEVKPEVKEIFESNPELQSIGTVEQYSTYIDSIFPDSKVKDVVYHGSPVSNIESFDATKIGTRTKTSTDPKKGFYFFDKQFPAKGYTSAGDFDPSSYNIYGYNYDDLETADFKSIEDFAKKTSGKVYAVVLNIQKLKIADNIQYINLDKEYENFDGFISDTAFDDVGGSYHDTRNDAFQYVVKKSEQIHILSSKKDIQGFRDFVGKNDNVETNEELPRSFENATPKQLPILKLERSEQEVVKPSQVLLPWKFQAKMSKYIKDGKLDMSKIDPKTLTGFGMRIPNQGPNSQTYFEIVGFLPKESGDLAIVSKDLVTQMGHDFDHDTFWTYLYETIEYDGILQPITQELTDRILSDLNITKEQIPELRRTLEFYKEELAELKEITFSTAKTTKEYEIAKGTKLKETSDKLFEELKAYSNLHKEVVRDINILISLNDILNGNNSIIKNKILDTHIAVHSNPNKTVQKQIKTPISGWILHDFAKKMDKISEKEFQLEYNRIVAENKAITANNTKNNTNNKLKDLPLRQARLSDAYQTDKFISGRSGKDGVGIFSLAGVFFSVLTQSNQNNKASDDNRIAYKILTEKGLKNWFLQVGNNHLDGTLDSLYSTNKILKTSIIEGVQSVSVDNANDVVMDKINLNTHTFKFVVGSVATGLDSQIPLIMNQPIIREYAKRIESGDKVGKNASNIAKSVYEELVKEYQTRGKITVDTKVVGSKTIEDTQSQKRKYLHAGKFLTDAVLDDMLVGPNTQADYYFLQLSVLNVFKELENVGASLQDVMSTTNTDSSLLDKSLIETSAKETRLDNVLSNSTIINIDRVLGNVLAGIKSLEPSTINGYATKYGLSFNNTLWDKLMPYNDVAVNEVFNRAAQKFGYDPKNVSKISNLKRKVWSGIRSYLLTDPRLGLTDKPIAEERKRLFFDVPNSNMSLASYIALLKSKTSTLQFINILNPEIDITGKEPSILSVSSAQLEESDMNSIYRGFLDLVIRDRKLPDFNGEPMTTRRLAGELALAATISGGVKDFKSYSHLIPPVYLYNITEKDSAVTYIEKLTSLIANPKLGDIFSVVGINDLIFQIAQHNPDLVANVDVKTFTAVGNAGEYRYKGTEVLDYEYLTTGRGRNTVLYKKKPNGLYVKVVTKTKLGYKAYEFRTLKGVNIEDHTHPVGKSLPMDNVNTTIEKNVVEHLMIQDGSEPDIQNTLSIIAQSSPATYNRKLASVFKSLITDTDIKISTGKLVTSSVDPITDEEVNTPIKGKYNPNTKTVHINTDKSAYKNGIDVYDLETTVLHELTHHITYSKFREAKRLINDGKTSSKIAMAVARLEGLFDKYKLEASKLKASGVTINENSTKNIDEFFSELITNPDVQKIADTIAYSADKSILDRFIDSVLSLLEALGINLDSTTAFALADIITIYRDTDSSNIELESNSTIAPFRDFMEYFPTKMDVSKEYGTIKNNDYVTFTNTTSKLKAKEINDSQGVYIAVPKEIALDSYIITLQKDTRMLDINYAYEQLNSNGKKKITDKIC